MSVPASISDSFAKRAAKAIMLAPIMAYRWTLSPLVGANCRHLPTCSDYAREAIEKNGAWRGGWLTLARLCRCHPWGSHGFDPVPDIREEHHPFAPWRYGRWRVLSKEVPRLRASEECRTRRCGARRATDRKPPAC